MDILIAESEMQGDFPTFPDMVSRAEALAILSHELRRRKDQIDGQ